MNKDLEIAKNVLRENEFTCVLEKDDHVFTSTKRGVAPLLDWIEQGLDLNGFSAADKVVGRGAAMLYILMGIQSLYAGVLSKEAEDALKQAGIEVVTHIILGLPGETPEMMVQTTKAAVEAGSDGVKFHLLHVLRGAALEQDYAQGKFRCLELPEYAQILDQCLAVLPAETVVHRLTGDGAKKDLVAPLWSADKKRVLQYLNQHLHNI